MPAEHRDNPITSEIVHRVFPLSEGLRDAVRHRRQALGLTLREFVRDAAEAELQPMAAPPRELRGTGDGDPRPARLPLTEPLLELLRGAADELGLPASRLLLACLARSARRKRRRRQ